MRTPQSTYRLQISAEFTLHDAAARIPALADLGVDWVYLSPILEAEPGSTHGYDVVAHDRIDASRGGPEGLRAVAEAAREHGMGVLVDIVPNHVGVATPERNAWWWDLLQHGRQSRYADAFDVDWEAGDGKILIPVVGDDDWSDDGRVDHVTIEEGGEALRYWETRYPIAPGTVDARGSDPQAVLERQHYRLVHWAQADDRLNYRRFFAVSTLAAIRVEEPEVFEASHVEIRRWFDEGLVQGLRVDHPDGLRDPAGYLDDLGRLTGGAFVLVEKILEPGEELPAWATAGTTGYDSLGMIDRVLTDRRSADGLDDVDAQLRGERIEWPELIHRTKRRIADGILRAEVLRLEREVRAADAWGERGAPDDTADAIAELLACFPVYRSYLPDGLEHLGVAAERAKEHRPDLAETVDALLPVLGNARQSAALRFQQTSGMVMAKGVEDTAFYRYSRLTSLNEVGGDPEVFSVTPHDFHTFMAARQADWPHAMNALSTHDTKRGEDVRARITTIAEVPEEWEALLDRLMVFAPRRGRAFANLLLQAIVGAWPAGEAKLPDAPADEIAPDDAEVAVRPEAGSEAGAVDQGDAGGTQAPELPTDDFAARLHAYAEKAAREADALTHWTDPDERWEAAVHELIDHVLVSPARDDIEAFLTRTEAGFRANVLAAKLLQVTIPGFPDVYQGSEVLEQSLVDPDNRRLVDWEALDAVRERAAEPVVDASDLGLAKTRVVREALRLRRERPDALTGYEPVPAAGEAADHVLAFDRGGVIAVVTRLPIGLERRGGWGDTTLALPARGEDAERWREVLTGRELGGGEVAVAELLDRLPVALLVRVD